MTGTALGPYRIVRELGAGGMGQVFEAVVERGAAGLAPGDRVAVKVLHAHLLQSDDARERFRREAEIGRSVAHENVVRTFDCGEVEEEGVRRDFLVMEHVEGRTLRALAGELTSIPEELCVRIGRDVARGLAAIHAAGAVHRDLKPENVLITREQAVKVMDLGIARLTDETIRLSQTGVFVGSLHYAAPECFSGGAASADHRADLHALGVLLYELATGVNPYEGDDVAQVLRRILHEPPRRLGSVNAQVSPWFEEVVHTLLAKDPSARFPDARALVAVFDEGERSPWWKARARALRAETRKALRRIRIPRETPVHGREWELSRLRALFDRAAAGEGQVVLLEGEAGVGKSRVLDEFVGLLERDGIDVHFLYGSYPPGGAATARGAFTTAYREHLGEDALDGVLAERLGEARGLAPAFAALLRGTPPPAGAEPLARDALQTCFVRVTRSLAAERPVVAVIDDLHFAPSEGRALFAALALAAHGHRLLLIGTARPELDEAWRAGIERIGAVRLGVRRLGAKDVAHLLRDALGSERTAEELAFRVIVKSDGNPYFVFEILRGLREGQFLRRREDGAWVTTRVVAEIEIPSSVLELVRARAAALSQEDRDLLDVAACSGFEFDPALVAAAAGVPVLAALQRFAAIERRHRLVRAAGRRLVFDHHQVQEALYASLYEQTREAYHAALAAATEAASGAAAAPDVASVDGAVCADLAEHMLRGGESRRALRYLGAALTHLEKGYLNDAALRLADLALAVPGLLEGAGRFALLLRKFERLELLGRRDDERRTLDDALALAQSLGGAANLARVRSREGRHLSRCGLPADAERVFREAWILARDAGDFGAEGAVVNSLGVLCFGQGRYDDAKAFFERSLEISRQTGDRRGEAACFVNLGNVHRHWARFEEAAALHDRGRALAAEIGHRQFEANATGGRGNVLTALERHAEAREMYERHLTLAREIGDRSSEGAAVGNLGGSYRALGRLADALDCHERQLALARETGDRRAEAVALANLGPLRMLLGDAARAQDETYAALALCRQVGARYPEGYALHALSRVADEQGNAERAVLRAREALALRREMGHGDGIADTLLELGDLLLRGGDAPGARAALDEAVTLLRAQRRASRLALALAVLARVPGRDGGGAAAAVPSAIAAAESASAALTASGEACDRIRARFLLHQATGNPAHLAIAKRVLDDLVAHAPPASREPMVAKVRVHRDVAAAAAAAGM